VQFAWQIGVRWAGEFYPSEFGYSLNFIHPRLHNFCVNSHILKNGVRLAGGGLCIRISIHPRWWNIARKDAFLRNIVLKDTFPGNVILKTLPPGRSTPRSTAAHSRLPHCHCTASNDSLRSHCYHPCQSADGIAEILLLVWIIYRNHLYKRLGLFGQRDRWQISPRQLESL
jgi:hypothetical protein